MASNFKKISEILSIPYQCRTELESLELLNLTDSIPFISRLREKYSKEFHQNFCKYLTVEKYSKNQYIWQKGEPSSKYYIILEGEVSFLESDNNAIITPSSSSSSSDELEEFEMLNNRRKRFKAFDVNPEIVYELSRTMTDISRDSFSIVPKITLENEIYELFGLIMQTNIGNNSEKELKVLKIGDDFGQESLLPNKKTQLHAVAKTQVELASLHQTIFRKIIYETVWERRVQMMKFLSNISLFSKFSKNELSKILQFFKLRSYKKGQYVYRQGDSPICLYFVSKGNFAISKNYAQHSTQDAISRNNLRNFSSYGKKVLVKYDLVVKGEYEILGAEEIFIYTPCRIFSCVCNSTSAEVFEVRKIDIENFLIPETVNEFLTTLKLSNNWLNARSEYLEKNQVALKTFDKTKPSEKHKTEKRRYSLMNDLEALNPSELTLNNIKINPTLVKPLKSQRIRWNSCETENIHIKSIKKNNPRLAPPNFLKSFRDNCMKRPKWLSVDMSIYKNF